MISERADWLTFNGIRPESDEMAVDFQIGFPNTPPQGRQITGFLGHSFKSMSREIDTCALPCSRLCVPVSCFQLRPLRTLQARPPESAR